MTMEIALTIGERGILGRVVNTHTKAAALRRIFGVVQMMVVVIYMAMVMVMMVGKIFVPPVVVMAVVLLRLGTTTTDDTHAAIGAQNTGWTFLAIGRTRFANVVVARVPVLVLFFHSRIVRLVVITCRSVAARLASNHFRSSLVLLRS